MKVLSNKEIEGVSGAGYFDDVNLYGGGYYNSSSNYGASLGLGYDFNFGGGTLTPSISGFNFSSGGNSFTPTYGLTYSFSW